MKPVPTRRAILAGATTLAMPAILRAQGTTQIEFYFPVAVGGPITKLIDAYAADFMRENPASPFARSMPAAMSTRSPRPSRPRKQGRGRRWPSSSPSTPTPSSTTS